MYRITEDDYLKSTGFEKHDVCGEAMKYTKNLTKERIRDMYVELAGKYNKLYNRPTPISHDLQLMDTIELLKDIIRSQHKALEDLR